MNKTKITLWFLIITIFILISLSVTEYFHDYILYIVAIEAILFIIVFKIGLKK